MALLRKDAMSCDQKETEVAKGVKGSIRGHLILAKMVIDALEEEKMGQTTNYYAIIEHLSIAQMKPVAMKRWLQALCLCVSDFSKNHDHLVGSTLKLVWYDKDQEMVDLYIEYLTSLVSAQTYFLRTILTSLTHHLWVPLVDGTGNGGESVLKNIHRAIEAILNLIPIAPSILLPLLCKNYPFKGKGTEIQELALRNVLYIGTYCPTLRDDILELVIHQLLAIDVELPSLEEEDDDNDPDTQFDVELEGVEKETSMPHSAVLGAHFSQKQVMKNEVAEKLDVMMTVCFQHFHKICHRNGRLDVDAAGNLLHSLLKILERVLLPTHACSSVQFLVFKITSLHANFPGYFLDFLWEKFQDPNTPAVLRQTSAAYMASYIARSKFVPIETIKLCLTIITQWIHEYLDNATENLKPDILLHGPFFSICQTLFYIFIFRHKSLTEMQGGVEFLRQLNFERIITSRLNPLKICLSSIVEMFASLANHHEIAFCYTILEQNKRLVLSSVGNSTPHAPGLQINSTPSQNNYLDCFFPFDPYQLKRSRKFIYPLYQEWEEIDEHSSAEHSSADEEEDRNSVASSMSYHETSQSLISSPEY